MKKLLFTTAVLGAALTSTLPAVAAQGCGPGFHRAPNGVCVADVVGFFYPGRGYWWHNHYWHHREHWRGGWRYR